MGKRGHSEEEILRVLREAESGDTVAEIRRKHGISQQTFYLWKKYTRLGPGELRELREENAKLKRSVADLSLDREKGKAAPFRGSQVPNDSQISQIVHCSQFCVLQNLTDVGGTSQNHKFR